MSKRDKRLKLPSDFMESLAALLKAKPPPEGWKENPEPESDMDIEKKSDPDSET